MDKKIRKQIKEYYEYHGEKLKSVRRITATRKVYDSYGVLIHNLESEAFSCVIETEDGNTLAEILHKAYDAHSEEYVTTTGITSDVDHRKEMENEWKELI